MNKPIRYHSDSQQNRLYYNYPIQQYSQPINLNRNRFQQEDQIDYIQNDFQNYDRKINQDHQQVEQNRTNLENNSKDQEISRNFANNNDNNDNDSYSLNSEEIEQFEQNKKFCMATDLCTVIELVLAIILLNMFYYIKGLQKYLINEVTFQPNETSKLIVTVASAFYIFCYYFTIDGNNQSQGCKITAIVVLTFIFQYLMLLYCIFLFKTLNQGCQDTILIQENPFQLLLSQPYHQNFLCQLFFKINIFGGFLGFL
ncbi:unnamed protein product [Paramecium pentaurelia]|uniref:Transmembrane protein n=1 Tax=Paramecium pentaurelia TaxID=43138 RepID=A0A8S1XU98_9CILI|nr:unnamed protein product [Paramecium pentaurelia]